VGIGEKALKISGKKKSGRFQINVPGKKFYKSPGAGVGRL
jgi:hypothetical protein